MSGASLSTSRALSPRPPLHSRGVQWVKGETPRPSDRALSLGSYTMLPGMPRASLEPPGPEQALVQEYRGKKQGLGSCC